MGGAQAGEAGQLAFERRQGVAQFERQEIFGALAAGAVVQRVACCPGTQHAFFMAGLGAKRLQRLAQLLDAHGRAGQWQPAVATGAGGCWLARRAARASIQFFQAIRQPSRMTAPGGSRASRKPG